jgi:amino acid transporter
MLTFISFWRAAAIVLCDLASSAFYVAGIAEQAIGKSAPWFILAVIIFASGVRAVYIEACVMFVRGGVYRVVKTALGNMLAKLSVSALMFDYILTGPISSVAAGHYLTGLINELLAAGGMGVSIPKGWGSALIAITVILYFWRKNLKGIHEASGRALRTMQTATILVGILIVWCLVTILIRGADWPPAPLPQNLQFSPEALGWLKDSDWIRNIGLLGILIAFGHSILAMSGEETLAQVNREIAHPKVRNLKRSAVVIMVYTVVFTGLVAFFGVMIIPDEVRPRFFPNMIGGLAMNVIGPLFVRFTFHAFVVVVGFLMLSGAVNTAMVGSNGVLNRVSEDGVLSGWFRHPHARYGTSYRIINMIALLQIGVILASRGDLYLLGEAYAFGVIWSFAFNSLAMLVLRYKNRTPREWRVPFNIRIGRSELPLGILAVLTLLLATAFTNILTKQVATLSGLLFTGAFYTLFTVSERMSRPRRETAGLDQFRLIREETIDPEVVRVRPAPVLVAVRDFKTLQQLELALTETNTRELDVVVVTARIIQGAGAGYKEIFEEHLFTEYEQLLFTGVVAGAEKMGKPVKLLAVPSNNPISAVVNVAVRLGCSRVYAGSSEKLSVPTQARLVGEAWEAIDDPDKIQFELIIVPEKGYPQRFQIGAHAPQMTPEDIELTHRIWLDIVEHVPEVDFHHRDVISMALRRFDHELTGASKDKIVDSLRQSASKERGGRPGRPRR